MTITDKNRQFLGMAKNVQDKHGVVILNRIAGIPPMFLSSRSSISYHIHKMEELGYLTRMGTHWVLSESGNEAIGGPPKQQPLKLLCEPELLAQRLSKDFRRTVFVDSPIDAVIPPGNQDYESFVDSLIGLVKVFVEGRCIKG